MTKVVVDEAVDTPANVTAHIADDERAAVHEGQQVPGAGEGDRLGRGVKRGGDCPIVAALWPTTAEVARSRSRGGVTCLRPDGVPMAVMRSSSSPPGADSGSMPSGRRSIFTAPCPGCGRAMVPLDATGYTCPGCGSAYRASLGYLVSVDQEGA